MEVDDLADNQDSWDNYFKFDHSCSAYYYIWKQAINFEALLFYVLVPQIERHTRCWDYLIHCQKVIKASWKVFFDADVFQEFWTFGKSVYFWLKNIQAQLYEKGKGKNDHNPVYDAHIVDKREELIPDKWKWRSFQLTSVHVKCNIEKIESEDKEKALDQKFNHSGQFNIESKNMQHNERGQNQRDKWKHFRLYQ